jgi:hypothetical protein
MISYVVWTISRDPRSPRIQSRLFHFLNKLALPQSVPATPPPPKYFDFLLCALWSLQSVLGLRTTIHRRRNSSSHTHAVSPHKSYPPPSCHNATRSTSESVWRFAASPSSRGSTALCCRDVTYSISAYRWVQWNREHKNKHKDLLCLPVKGSIIIITS